MRLATVIVVTGFLVVGCAAAPASQLDAGAGCRDVHVEVVLVSDVSIAMVSADSCVDGAGSVLPAADATDRLASAAWIAELPRFDRVDASVVVSAETYPFARRSVRSYSPSELESRWGGRPARLDVGVARHGPTGPWILLPLAGVLVLGGALRAARSGSIVVIGMRAR
ncbi:hypothetical protein [Pseudonocardia abyssalis]|uniref:Lipoprotein n=1 Tax=Pseudonocardia abyssalis TaxID=2792008 RepID=A0ABS6URQ5_9PSEU|nr:hypothetical protein [Pseudonocardia abyssalis]MBW0113823.1 hypothetical protein [Pseudonocardia abyssalis]MBW0134935.1 hypothetical protein [Pseudonocardia abyssalis]